MKKNKKKGHDGLFRLIRKGFLIMRLFLIFMVLGILQGTASVYSQNKRFSLNEENISIREVIQLIETQSEYRFFYEEEQLNVNDKLNLNVENSTLKEVLDELFKQSGVEYKMLDNNFIVLKSLKDVNGIQFSQNKTVSGNITDLSGSPLPGVSIIIKETTKGTITDFDGNYSLRNVPEDAILIFSFVGMKTSELSVAGQTVFNLVMEDDAIGIDEVVAIGYGYQKKSDLTGAVVSVSSEDLNLGGTVSNAAQALQGRTAGVLVTQNSKAPGGSISIRIRGTNSINSSNEPLYVVDGFPTTNGAEINPNDIESMQILKDASATAIYGSRGANGVILITTKRGKAGENNISYNGYVGTQQVVNPFDMLNGKQFMNLANDLFKEIDGQENQENAVYTQSQLQSNVNTDWVDVATRMGMVQDHNIQFKGGSDKTKVMTSLGYFDQKGVLKNTDFSRLSGRVNVDQTINEYIKAGVSLVGQRENSNTQNYSGNILNSNVLYSVLTYDPTVSPYNEDGSFGRPPGGRGDNPLANLLSRNNDVTTDKLNGNMFLEISPIEGLTARINGGVEIVNSYRGTYLPRSTYQGGIDNGVASTRDYRSTHQLFDAIVSYKTDFNELHSLSVMGGYSYEKSIYDWRTIGVKGFSTDLYSYNNVGAASTITGVSSYKGENLLISYFGRLNYSFSDKYLATATVRADGSSRFGENNRWGYFPSGSLAWRLINEPFIQDMDVFSNLKFRLGFGVTGNERIGNYSSLALMKNTHVTFDGNNNTAGTHLNQSTPENPELKWEKTSQFNTGIDMAFFNSRLAVTIDAYYKKTSDLLVQKNFPQYSGFFSGQVNAGEIENKGFEFDMTSSNLIGEFKWNTKLNFAINRNKVLSLGGEPEIYLGTSKPMGNVSEESFAVIREGEPLGSLFGYQYEGVIQQGENYAPQPNAVAGDPKFKDISGPEGTPDGKITSDDRTILGESSPKFIFGITNSFEYKDFDLSVFVHGSIGNKMLNMTSMNMEWSRTTEALDRWTASNTNTDIPRNGFYYSKYGGYTNSHFIEDASFVRLKNITLGYTIPKSVAFLQSLRVFFTAENLLTITKYTGWDPEVDTKGYEAKGTQSANAGAGLDFNSYPSMKSFTIGLNVTF